MKISASITGIEQVRAMMQRIGPELSGKALSSTALDLENYIRTEAGKHFKHGQLNSSIFKTQRPDGSWLIGHDEKRAPHAVFVLWGTKPHKILPRNKKALRWPAGGSFVFAKGVNHPGNKPDNWIQRAASAAPMIFSYQVERHLLAIINQGLAR